MNETITNGSNLKFISSFSKDAKMAIEKRKICATALTVLRLSFAVLCCRRLLSLSPDIRVSRYFRNLQPLSLVSVKGS